MEVPKSNGFTIVELMVVIAIVAIVTSYAVPSYRTLIEKRELSSGAEQISAFLSVAKMEASKRNEQIAIWRNLSAGCMGFYSYDPDNPRNNCDCTLTDPDAVNACAIDEFDDSTAMGLRVINDSLLNNPLNITAIDVLGRADELVVFDPIRGMLVVDNPVQIPLELKMLSTHETYGLNVRLTLSGRVTICSDLTLADNPVPGYDQCR